MSSDDKSKEVSLVKNIDEVNAEFDEKFKIENAKTEALFLFIQLMTAISHGFFLLSIYLVGNLIRKFTVAIHGSDPILFNDVTFGYFMEVVGAIFFLLFLLSLVFMYIKWMVQKWKR